MSVTLISFAKQNDVINITTDVECFADDPPEETSHITFYGVLGWYYTQAGALIITCSPPFTQGCYTLIWNLQDERSVILNDGYDTEISVSSDPITIIDENGNEVHTLTIN